MTMMQMCLRYPLAADARYLHKKWELICWGLQYHILLFTGGAWQERMCYLLR